MTYPIIDHVVNTILRRAQDSNTLVHTHLQPNINLGAAMKGYDIHN